MYPDSSTLGNRRGRGDDSTFLQGHNLFNVPSACHFISWFRLSPWPTGSLMSSKLAFLGIAGCVFLLALAHNFHLQLLLWPYLTIHQLPQSSVAMTPYLFHITLVAMANCFKVSETHFAGALNLLDCNKTSTLNPQLNPRALSSITPQSFVFVSLLPLTC